MNSALEIAITVLLGLAGAYAIWRGDAQARPYLKYGGAATLVVAIALVLITAPSHHVPGQAGQAAEAANPTAPTPAISASGSGTIPGGQAPSQSSATIQPSPSSTFIPFFPRGVPPPEPAPPHPTPTPTHTPSSTPSPTPSPTPTETPSPTPTDTPSPTPTDTPSPTPTDTPSPTPTDTPSPTPTDTPSPTPTDSPTPSPSAGPGLPLLPAGRLLW